MTKTITAPRVRQTNLYTVECDGQPVAQAMAISQAEAVRLYVESMQQPTMSARLSSPLEARTLAGLPLLQREPIAVATRTADLFGDALLSDEPMAADISADAAEHLQACGVNIVAADHVEDMLAMVQEPAAVQPGEPAGCLDAAPTAGEPVGASSAVDDDGGRQLTATEQAAYEAQGAARFAQHHGSELKRQAEAATARADGKIVAKYRNPTTGESWSGRGLRPRWLVAAMDEGKALEDFAV